MKCSFCGIDIPPGTGKIFVKPDGTFYTFCSNKCEKNMLKLKRSPQKIKWSSKYHKEKEIRLYGKEKKEKKEKVVEKKPEKKRPSKKERRELRKKRKLEKKKARLERKAKKESGKEEKAGGEK